MEAALPTIVESTIPIAYTDEEYSLTLETSDADGDFVRVVPFIMPEWLELNRRLSEINNPMEVVVGTVSSPQDITSFDGDLFILESDAVHKLDLEEETLTQVTDFPGIGWGEGHSIVTGADDFLYITDSENHQVVRMDPISGSVTTYAGSPGEIGATNGHRLDALFFSPTGLSFDSAGNLYIAEKWGNRIRKISISGEVSTLVEEGLFSPAEIATDTDGNLWVANSLSNQLLKIDTATGETLSIVGTGLSGIEDGNPEVASFASPHGLAVDGNGELWVTCLNGVIRRMDEQGVVTTLEWEAPEGINLQGVGANKSGAVCIVDNSKSELFELTFEYFLSGQPELQHSGNAGVSLLLYDGTGNIESHAITIPVNAPPALTSDAEKFAIEEVLFEYTVTVSDPNGDTPLITAVTLPSWLSFSDGNALQGTPGESDIGEHTVTLLLSDDRGAEEIVEIYIEVVIGNDPPQIISPSVTTAAEDIEFSFLVIATDSDEDDTATITIEDVPDWLTMETQVDGSILLAGIPLQSDVGAHVIQVTAEDLKDATVEQSLTITVEHSNDAPTFSSATEHQLVEDDLFQFTVEITDEDPGDSHTLSATLLPSWLAFTDNNDGTALLSGTPLNEHVGQHSVELKVTDAADAEGLTTLSLTVTNTNDPPAITSPSEATSTEDTPLQFTIEGSDIDVGDTLALEVLNLPNWLSFEDNNDGTGLLQGTPLNEHVGQHALELQVTDADGLKIKDTLALTVTNTNDPPEFTSVTQLNLEEDTSFQFTVEATDQDIGDVLTLEVNDLPDWLSFQDNSDGTARLEGTPLNEHVGQHTLEFEVADAEGVEVSSTLTLTVTNTNDPPFFTSSSELELTEDVQFQFTLSAADVDVGDTLTLAPVGLPNWLTFVDNLEGTATLSGTPLNEHVGEHILEIRVEDAESAQTTQFLTIHVTNTNDPVFWTSEAPSESFMENTDFLYELTAGDVDIGDELAFSATVLPDWLKLMDHGVGTASLSGLVPVSDQTTYEVTLQVEDIQKTQDTQSFSIHTIENPNHRPIVEMPGIVSLNFDSGLFESVFTVRNNSEEVFFFNLSFAFHDIPETFSLAPDAETDESGNPVVHLSALRPGESTEIILELTSLLRDPGDLEVPVSYSIETSSLPITGTRALGSHYYQSSWFGLYYAKDYPWIWHETLGWLYFEPDTPDHIWFFHTDHGWHYTSKDTYPYLLDNDSQGWLYVPPEQTQPNIRVYDYTTMTYKDW